MNRRLLPAAAALSLGLALSPVACASRPTVTRVVDGRIVEGAIVLPDEYATFLGGAMAEEQGDLSVALHAYESVSEMDPRNPEIWTRIGMVRCQKDPRDGRAMSAIERALSIDPEYAAAWMARARCELLRGVDRGDVESSARRATDLDPQAVAPQVILATALAMQPGAQSEAARERLVALTLKQRTSTAAWRALGAWGKSHRDPALVARAYGEVARIAPAAHAEVAAEILELAGEGELIAARSLAGALVDARRTTGAGAEAEMTGAGLVARLAVDDAIVAGDSDRARRRAVASHLALDVVAGRALLLGRADMARDFAEPLRDADPHAVGPRLVLAILAYEADDRAGITRAFAASGSKSGGDSPVAVEVLLPFLRAVSRGMGAAIARQVATAFPPSETIVAGDALVVPLAVALVDSGSLPPASLSADGRLELAVRRGELVTGSLDALNALDARHRLLALASTRPTSNEARALLRHVGAAWERDPLVAVAMGRMAVAGAVVMDSVTPTRLAEVAPEDPLVAATALELAQKHGNDAAERSIRARLSAIATGAHQAR